MSIGKNIAQFRKQKGLTQAELGNLLGVSNQAVSKWESEVNMPDILLLPKIAQVLSVSIDELYSGKLPDTCNIEETAKKKGRILALSVGDLSSSVKIKIPIEAIRALLCSENAMDKIKINDKTAKMFLQMLDKCDSAGTLTDVDAGGFKTKITVEEYDS